MLITTYERLLCTILALLICLSEIIVVIDMMLIEKMSIGARNKWEIFGNKVIIRNVFNLSKLEIG